jgi:CubicO group peptidase (beta-lactamase class C family)
MHRIILVALVFLGCVMAQVQVPATPAGAWFKDFLEVYNRFDPKAYVQFYTERFDPKVLERYRGGVEEAVKRLGSLYATQGKLRLDSLNAKSPTQLEALVQGTLTQSWLRFELVMDTTNPRRIVSWGIRPGAAPAGTKPTRVEGDRAFAQALGQHLDKLRQNGLFSGVVLVSKNGNRIFEGAYGKRNEAGEQLDLRSKFPLSSMSKMFTAIAIAQLVEAGKLSYNDLVSKHLPNYPAERIQGMTIHHLLSHTSGIGFFDLNEIAFMTTVSQMLGAKIVETTPFKPGERFVYTNTAYLLLGGVIEQVSGEDYFEYLKRHIFVPLGMNDTGNFALNETTPGFATGFVPDLERWYTTGKLEWRSNKDTRLGWANPSGDMTSTVSDLLRFGNALREGKLVKPETLALMSSPKSEAPYGYGFEVLPGNRIGHTGGSPGQETLFAFDLKQGYSVIVLSNQDRAMEAVRQFVLGLN